MKKKVLSLLLAATMVFGLVGCGSSSSSDGEDASNDNGTDTYELALITDVGTIDDKSFNQGTWEGLVKYADENDIAHKYYKPAEKSDDACLNAIDLAVKGGAKVIALPGFIFEVPMLTAQDKYPDVKFIFIDGNPHAVDDYTPVINDNVRSIFFAEEQAGYLAGYAAVKEGYTKLGFMGGIAVPAVVRYGYGYIQGADAAAVELGVTDVEVKYYYTGDFAATPENQALAASWYSDGTEVIFACGGAVGNSVMKAAESAGAKVIGVDVDQSSESDTVITSAMKELGTAVYSALEGYYSDSFEGGVAVTLGASEDAIGLPMDTSKFENFTKEDYDAVFAQLVDGTITVGKDDIADDATGVETQIVKVNLVK